MWQEIGAGNGEKSCTGAGRLRLDIQEQVNEHEEQIIEPLRLLFCVEQRAAWPCDFILGMVRTVVPIMLLNRSGQAPRR
jgi:hypothetical protein